MQPTQPLPRAYLQTPLADRSQTTQKRKEMENPPLWVWAIVVGLIIAGKYAYRWKTTKQLATEMEQKKNSSKATTNSSIKNDNNTESATGVRTAISHKYSRHKYSPNSYRDYFEKKKRKVRTS
ncbi:MAG: hypothetical protein M3297_00245 [Thermoproteota archaeon]|nr:hypothetical protein [Thermoproteota archaeon]